MLIGIDASRAFVDQRTGTENYSYQLIKEIAKIDHKNQYVLYTRDDTSNKPMTDNRKLKVDLSSIFFQLPSNINFKPVNFFRLWTQIGLAKEVLLNPPDVLFIPAHTLPIIRRPGQKTVVTIHDLGYEYLPQYHQFPQKLYLNKSTEFAVWHSTHLIAVSEATKRDLIRKLCCPKDKITVVYEGFDQNNFQFPISNFQKNRILKKLKITHPYILFVGTLQPRKNIERLIEAFAKICHCEAAEGDRGNLVNKNKISTPRLAMRDSAWNDGTSLVIAGNKGWMYEDILQAPKKFGVEKQVKFLGYTTDDDLAVLYSGALCLCLPSLFEGFGLPVLEAMACGCPVLVSNISSLPEVAGEAGLFVDPYNVNDIAKKLQLIINNEKLRIEMRKKSLNQAKKFSWEKCAKETIGILEEINFLT